MTTFKSIALRITAAALSLALVGGSDRFWSGRMSAWFYSL